MQVNSINGASVFAILLFDLLGLILGLLFSAFCRLFKLIFDPHFLEFFLGNTCDHFIDPLFVDFIREFTGLPVLHEDNIKLEEPVRVL